MLLGLQARNLLSAKQPPARVTCQAGRLLQIVVMAW